MKYYAVYLLTNRPGGSLYTGLCGDLVQRVWQHKLRRFPGFARCRGAHRLIWYELHEMYALAELRQREIRSWSRRRKLAWIEQHNPTWADLWEDIVAAGQWERQPLLTHPHC